MDQCSLSDGHKHVRKMQLPVMRNRVHDANQPRWRGALTGVVAPVGGHSWRGWSSRRQDADRGRGISSVGLPAQLARA